MASNSAQSAHPHRFAIKLNVYAIALSWALLSDEIPRGQGAQFFGLANLATAGASALVGLFGPLLDLINHFLPGYGYTTVFFLAALFALSSLLPLRGSAQGASQP